MTTPTYKDLLKQRDELAAQIEEARKKKLEKKAEKVAKQEVAPSLFDFEG